MSKYTRLNKINHYHDSSSSSSSSSSSGGSLTMGQTIELGPRLRPPRAINNRGKQIDSPRQPASNYPNVNSHGKLPTRHAKNYNLKIAFLAIISISMLLLLINLDGVRSLNCYHCSSVDDPGCDEAFTGRANYTDTDCGKHLKADQVAKVCRKIVQYIEHKKVVIRSCGFIDEHEEKDRKAMCYKRSGTFAIMMESCNCYEDNCNHSASLVPNRSVLLLLAASCSVLLLFYTTSGVASQIGANKRRQLTATLGDSR